MPVYAEWANQSQTIIHLHLHEPWRMSDYIEASAHTQALMKSVTHPVHLIIDLTDVTTFPKDILPSIPTINAHILPDQGLVIPVKLSRYLQLLTKFVVRLFPRFGRNLVFAQTLKEAYAIIDAHDQPASRSR